MTKCSNKKKLNVQRSKLRAVDRVFTTIRTTVRDTASNQTQRTEMLSAKGIKTEK